MTPKSTFETYLREIVLKAARSIGVRRVGNLFVCPRVLKSCFNAYILPNLEYCAPVWMPSLESYLSLVDRVVRSVERLC